MRQLIDSEIVAIDEFGYIFQEYRKHLTLGGSRNVGDEFFKYLFENQYNHDRIQQIRISPSNDDDIGFEELPANKLDPSDRKFLAVSVKAGATILNATDSDWDEQGLLLQKLGVETCQLCPENSRK
ncbi:MAG: hypothetical protein OXF60_06550 [Gammaproteobacteria bacterium]|nr:hypothetical protein [Gammaproteobacteria bacterium]